MEPQFERSLPHTSYERLPDNEENAMARAEILKTLHADIEGLSILGNAEILDRAIGEQGASSRLAETIRSFSQKLADQDIQIVKHSSAEDILRKSEAYLIPFVNRIKKYGFEDRYVKAVQEGFGSLRDYVDLLDTHFEFEKSEFGDERGFLKGRQMEDEEIDRLVAQKEYIDTCRKIIEKGETIH